MAAAHRNVEPGDGGLGLSYMLCLLYFQHRVTFTQMPSPFCAGGSAGRLRSLSSRFFGDMGELNEHCLCHGSLRPRFPLN
jgi:hypothetical protein